MTIRALQDLKGLGAFWVGASRDMGLSGSDYARGNEDLRPHLKCLQPYLLRPRILPVWTAVNDFDPPTVFKEWISDGILGQRPLDL